ISTKIALASRQYGSESWQNRATWKLALNRNRAPLGGTSGLRSELASWRAGHRKAAWVSCAVNLIACSIGFPVRTAAWTCAKFSRPGRMGKPAASADVQPAGRSRLDRKCQMAPEPAVEPFAEECGPPPPHKPDGTRGGRAEG